MGEYYTVLTDDYRLPVLGGASIWDGSELPHALPVVELDLSPAARSGWYCADTLAGALRQDGFWRNGRPCVGFAVSPGPDLVGRSGRFRTSTLVLVRRVTGAELKAAVLRFSECFGAHAEQMAAEQWAWYLALGRPESDPIRVEEGLLQALAARGLGGWALRRFESAWAVSAARAASGVWDTMAAAVRHPWDVGDGRAHFAAGRALDANASVNAKDATYAWHSSEAPAAKAALTLTYAALCGWVDDPPDLLTAGLRNAYHAGLELAVPTRPGELGWAMADRRDPPLGAAALSGSQSRGASAFPRVHKITEESGTNHDSIESTFYTVLPPDDHPSSSGVEPDWDGKVLPHQLPRRELSPIPAESKGWFCAETLAGALAQGGLWPDLRPAQAFAVEPGKELICRHDGCRASTLTLQRRVSEAELRAAIRQFSRCFGFHGDRMAEEQWAWYVALGRPELDPPCVEACLRQALSVRGLEDWTLRRFNRGVDAWATRTDRNSRAPDAGAARYARDVWSGTEPVTAWRARFAWAAGENRHRKASSSVTDVRDAWGPMAALTVTISALSHWVLYPPGFLSEGLREAYFSGLEIAVPTGPKELGWAMAHTR